MSYSSIRKAIQSHLVANLSTGVVPVNRRAWDNVVFSIPTDNTPWIRVSVLNNVSKYASIGSTKKARREGLVSVQVFVPTDTDTNAAYTIVDAVVAVFETKLLNGIIFRSPNVREIGSNEGWFQINIAVEFRADENVTAT